ASVRLLRGVLLRDPVGACPGHTVTGAVLSALAVDAAVNDHRHLEGELLHPVAAGKPQGDGATAVIGGFHVVEAQRIGAILAGVALGAIPTVATDDPPQVVRDTLGRGDDKVAVPVDHSPGQANAILRRRQSLDRLLDVLRNQALNVFGQKVRDLLRVGVLAVRAISAALAGRAGLTSRAGRTLWPRLALLPTLRLTGLKGLQAFNDGTERPINVRLDRADDLLAKGFSVKRHHSAPCRLQPWRERPQRPCCSPRSAALAPAARRPDCWPDRPEGSPAPRWLRANGP